MVTSSRSVASSWSGKARPRAAADLGVGEGGGGERPGDLELEPDGGEVERGGGGGTDPVGDHSKVLAGADR